jgi:hypothetical protein
MFCSASEDKAKQLVTNADTGRANERIVANGESAIESSTLRVV